MFYLTIPLALLFLVWQYHWLKKTERHDKHLYRLCQVRREAMHLLINEYDTLPYKEAIALRKDIKGLNTIIGKYSTHKTHFFNFRLFISRLQKLKSFELKQESANIENEKVIDLRRKSMAVIFGAFLDYTPFLRHEIVIRVCIVFISVAVKAGVQSLREFQKSLEIILHTKQSNYSCAF